MSDDEYRNGFDDATADNGSVAELTPEQVAEEAKAEEEFISAPEDTVENPLVPEEKKADDEDEDRLKGAIGSGNLAADYPEEKELVSNEGNMDKNEIAETEAPAVPAETNVNDAPVAESAPAEAVAETPAETPEVASVSEQPASAESSVIAGASATPAASVADMAAQGSVAPKKKKKTGLIVGIIITLLLLVGAGVGLLVWIMMRESPDSTLKDALSKLWSADNMQANIVVSAKDASGNNTNLTIDGVKDGAKFSGEGKIKTSAGGKDIEIEFSAAYIDSDNMYFKLKNLDKIADSLGSTFGALVGGSTYAELLSGVLGTVVDKIDGQWYKISTSDIKSTISSSNPYSCMIDSMSSLSDKKAYDKVEEIYKKHRFLSVDSDAKVEEKDGVKYYTIKSDEEESKKFKEEAEQDEALEGLVKCFSNSSLGIADDDYDYGSDALNKIFSDDSETAEIKKKDSEDKVVVFGIKPWSHELVDVKISSKNNSDSSATIKISYDKKEVVAPEGAKSIDDLKKDIEESLKGAITSYVDKICEEFGSTYGESYVSLCKTSAMQSLGDFDLGDIFKQFGGSDSISM